MNLRDSGLQDKQPPLLRASVHLPTWVISIVLENGTFTVWEIEGVWNSVSGVEGAVGV